MPEKNIFSQDVEVPEIVRERADTALLKIKEERKTKMVKNINFKRLVKPFAAAAACAVLMVGAFMCAVNGRDRNADGNGIVPANVFSLQVIPTVDPHA